MRSFWTCFVFFFAVIVLFLPAASGGFGGARGARLTLFEALMPLCGIASGENITRCGMAVKDFLPHCVKNTASYFLLNVLGPYQRAKVGAVPSQINSRAEAIHAAGRQDPRPNSRVSRDSSSFEETRSGPQPRRRQDRKGDAKEIFWGVLDRGLHWLPAEHWAD
jgi:hypothetical protein